MPTLLKGGSGEMMPRIDKETRFYLDVDLKSRKVLGWGYGQRQRLEQKLPGSDQRRIFITLGQYHKLEETVG